MGPAVLVLRADDPLETALVPGVAAVLVDLASAASEESRRQAAALLARTRVAPGGPRRWVRVSALGSGSLDADLAAIVPEAPDVVVLPGSRSGADVQHLATKLAVHEAEAGLPDGATGIVAVLDHPAGLLRTDTYAGASLRLAGLAWDAERLAAAFGLTDLGTKLPAPIALARTLTVVAAHAAGVAAIDTACRLEGDALAAACLKSRRDGFRAKFATTAGQCPAIEAAFGLARPLASGRDRAGQA